MSDNIVEALKQEIKRNRELLDIYKSIPTGIFAAKTIEFYIDNAIAALGSGDPVEIIRAYKSLKDNE